jgi:hypothetical protein
VCRTTAPHAADAAAGAAAEDFAAASAIVVSASAAACGLQDDMLETLALLTAAPSCWHVSVHACRFMHAAQCLPARACSTAEPLHHISSLMQLAQSGCSISHFHRYTNIHIGPPCLEEEYRQEEITPQQCRLRDITYAGEILKLFAQLPHFGSQVVWLALLLYTCRELACAFDRVTLAAFLSAAACTAQGSSNNQQCLLHPCVIVCCVSQRLSTWTSSTRVGARL